MEVSSISLGRGSDSPERLSKLQQFQPIAQFLNRFAGRAAMRQIRAADD